MRLISSFINRFWQWFLLRVAFAFLRSARFCEQHAGHVLAILDKERNRD
ncbi:hypothetical protein EV217_2878 [Phyllobacterium myrsinacearum]|nr:hypothetical protein EV217_2878 [Phyllobacterium myrsinacearum]